jgi:hypothetical protein
MENYKTITKMSKWYQKYFYRKDAKGLRKERKVLNLSVSIPKNPTD